jgi:hypothetical protein
LLFCPRMRSPSLLPNWPRPPVLTQFFLVCDLPSLPEPCPYTQLTIYLISSHPQALVRNGSYPRDRS